MLNHKLKASQASGAAELLFGKDAGKPWAERTAAEDGHPPPPPPPAVAAKDDDVPALERASYRILRGRIEHLRSITFVNRQGQRRVFPWSYFAGANMDQPGELVLLFDGPEGSSSITVSGGGLDEELLPGIEACRVEWIHEVGDALSVAGVVAKRPTEPVVTGIWIVGAGREWSRGAPLAKGGRQP
jgi:hypothetical protein